MTRVPPSPPGVRRWFSSLRPLCAESASADVVVFYLARWCQKKARTVEPRPAFLGKARLRDVAERIAGNLAADGPLVERLVAGDAEALTELRGTLRASARTRVGQRAYEFADEALQKISLVLLTGTPPSRAAEELGRGPDGPRNEYVFDAPFSNWARTVVINLVRDDWRRMMRSGHVETAGSRPPDRELVERAQAALPGLLQAIRELPTKQRAVMVLSLLRRDVDEAARAGLHDLAPDLFDDAADVVVVSDKDIAGHLGSTRRRVGANRSAARRKLVKQDPVWELLLDLFLPHRTTKPVEVEPDA